MEPQLELLSAALIKLDLRLHTKFVESLTPQREALGLILGSLVGFLWGGGSLLLKKSAGIMMYSTFHPNRSVIYVIS